MLEWKEIAGVKKSKIKWARFNKPETKNNIIYGIAYLDEYGNELDFK